MWPLHGKREEGKGTLYLVKANDDFVSFCRCKRALASSPPQMDCPWCGCGWLFTCIECRKAFTFAKAVVVPQSLEELGRDDLRGRWHKDPSPEQLAEWVEWMKMLLKPIEAGKVYVYFDGTYFPTDASGIKLDGWHAHHDLMFVPQVEAMRNPEVRETVLSNKEYWETRKNLEAQ